MQTTTVAVGKKSLWTGRVIRGLVVLFLLFDSITKLLRVDAVVKASAQLGYSVGDITIIGAILLACVVVYLVPRTAILGAVLLTGYLGGAVDANLRIGTPIFSNLLFPVYFGILVWAGLILSGHSLRVLFPLRRAEAGDFRRGVHASRGARGD